MSLFSFGPVALGLLLVAVGLHTLTAKRPLVLAARGFPIAILICFLPEQVALLVDAPVSLSLPLRSQGLVVIAASALLFWIFMGGYVIFAATEDQLDAAMAEALTRLQQPFEKTTEGMRLTAQNATLKVRMGVQDVWSVSISPRTQRRLLVAVASGMRVYFDSRIERGSRSGSYVSLVGGAVILLLELFEAIVLGI